MGNLSHPWNCKTSGCTLRFLFPPLQSTCDLASVELLLVAVPGCVYSLQSPSGVGGLVLSSPLEDTKLLREVTLAHILGNTLSSHSTVWSHLILALRFYLEKERAEGCCMSHTFQVPRSLSHPGKFSWVFVFWFFFLSSFVHCICWWSNVICKSFVCIVHNR